MTQRNSPLASKPSSAPAKPDLAPHRRFRHNLAPTDANDRTSAYDVYDNYLDNSSRNSGIGALGRGFMNASMDDDDDDDDDDDEVFTTAQKPKSQPAPAPSPATALVPASAPAPAISTPSASASTTARSSRPSTLPIRSPGPPPAVESHPQPLQLAIPLAAPRPGYAAPIAALNLAPPSPAVSPTSRGPPHGMTIQAPLSSMLMPSPSTPVSSVPSTPHPLLPPSTPITPAFARPPKSPTPRETVKFAAIEPIMRSNTEDPMLPKRGEKGDDFWRRFSVIAKEESKKPPKSKESSWLRQNQNASTRMSRWVWAAAIIILLAIAGGVTLRIYTARGQHGPQQPAALGGSANITAAPSLSTSPPRLSSTGLPHVSPTNTVARRMAIPYANPTGISIRHRQIPNHPRYHGRKSDIVLPE